MNLIHRGLYHSQFIFQFFKLSAFRRIDKQKQNNLVQNEELAKLRDWLLPMLMNGQLKVGEEK